MTIENTTCLRAEALAIQEGMEYCVRNHSVPLIVETDSLTMHKVIEGVWDCPWSISLVVQSIKEWRSKENVQIKHTLREGNQLGDFLTNKFVDFAGTNHYYSFQDLPAGAKKILNSDKQQIANIRLRAIQEKEPD